MLEPEAGEMTIPYCSFTLYYIEVSCHMDAVLCCTVWGLQAATHFRIFTFLHTFFTPIHSVTLAPGQRDLA